MAVTGVPAFRGRARERETLDRLLDGVRAGASGVLVIRGEAGIGKTSLLHYCARRASDCRVAQIAGFESELEMPFAALHQLCGPLLDHLAALPEPQDQALQVAFGLAAGSAPDRFVIGLAVLSLLAQAAAKQPLVCLVDDAQWLDDASCQVLAFVGRRLLAEAVMVVLAVREEADERLFPALPALTLEGLNDDEARALLADVVPGQLDDRVRDRIVAETRGNPLGLLELPRRMGRAELAGGFALPTTARLSGHLEDHYAARIRALPDRTRRLMLLAAADPTGDTTLLWRAARTLGLGPDAAAAADSEQLLVIGTQVRFRHPLVRSAAYASATQEDRRAIHLALAAATDEVNDPARRVWHLAAAATGPDEDVASELERAAGIARGRAGLAAAAAFLERAAALSADPERRADRALNASIANLHAGAFDTALGLLAEAGAGAVNDLQRARVERLRGQIQWASKPGRDAPALLVQAAKRLEPLDVELARETYLDAWIASTVAGPLAQPGSQLADVSRAARLLAHPSPRPRPCDVLLDGLATLVTDGQAVAEPDMRRAMNAFLDDQASGEDWLRWGSLATAAAAALWDVDSWALLSARHVEITRASGALVPFSLALNARVIVATLCGDLDAASSLAARAHAIHDVTGVRMATDGALLLAAYRGRFAEASPLLSAAAAASIDRGEGFALQLASWATAVLDNGLGRYADALAAARQATEEAYQPFSTQFVLQELVEAAIRTGSAATANDALGRLSAVTDIEGSDWAAGIDARSRALVSDGEVAEQWYATAVERLGRTQLRTELARAHLLYGEWLRREKRRTDAREQLRTAFEMFTAMGADAFAERARRELLATGEKVRAKERDTHTELTPQEEHIARLARDGRTNTEIASELFLSARTVEWHLRKVFMKLGITSRRGLQDVLPARDRYIAPDRFRSDT